MFPTLSRVSILLAGVLAGVGLTLGGAVLAERKDAAFSWQDARLFAQVMQLVKENYVDAVPDRQLMQSAVRGMVANLDPYSAFLDAQDYEDIRDNATGEYSGIGIEIALQDGAVKVIAPIDDTPAAKAGIKAGDEIVAIDDASVDSTNLSETIERMRGHAGSKVKLTVTREGSPQPLQFALERANVQVHSVRQEVLDPAGYGYVRISHFSETTTEDLTRAVADLRSKMPAGLKGLVLDLRDNPGGVLEAAVGVSDALLNSGVIVTADGRAKDSKFEMDAEPGDILEGAPLTVLVDGGSASASEIVAGSLHDHHRATLVGQKTYGKGLVQTVIPLDEGRALKLTTSRYYTPWGISINGTGITPDVIVTEADLRAHQNAGEETAVEILKKDYEVQVALDTLKGNGRNRQTRKL